MKGVLAFVIATAGGALLTPPNAAAAIKCWINDQGIRECGNAVPPEYAQDGHDVVSDHGIVVDRKDRIKTPEELAEEARMAEIEAQRRQVELEKERADRVLLDTFSSEDDLVLARDGQIASLDAQIRLTESRIEKLEANLNQLVNQAAESERRGEIPSSKLVTAIDNVRQQIDSNQNFIQRKLEEQTQVREKFAADIKRFNELLREHQAQN